MQGLIKINVIYASFDKESLNIFDIEVREQHARASPRRYQSWFV